MNELNCFELAEGVAEDTMGLPMVVHIATKFQVNSEFAVGASIAWFSGGIVTLFFKDDINIKYFLFSVIGLLISWLFLQLAVEYRVKAKIK